MRHVITIGLFLFASLAQAKTICTVNRVNPSNATLYDQPVFTGEVEKERLVIFKADGQTATETDFEALFKVLVPDFKDMEALKKALQPYVGAPALFISVHESGTVTYSLMHFDLEATENLLVLDFASSTMLGHDTMIIDGRHHFAASCHKD